MTANMTTTTTSSSSSSPAAAARTVLKNNKPNANSNNSESTTIQKLLSQTLQKGNNGQALNLCGYRISRDIGIRTLVDEIQSKYTNLQSLALRWEDKNDDRRVYYDVLKELFTTNIREVDLGWNHITDQGCRILFGSKNNTLESIDLSMNDLTNVGCRYLSEMLQSNTTITKLNISNNYPITISQGIQQFATVLEHSNTTLLQLQYNNVANHNSGKQMDAQMVSQKIQFFLYLNQYHRSYLFQASKNYTLSRNEYMNQLVTFCTTIQHSFRKHANANPANSSSSPATTTTITTTKEQKGAAKTTAFPKEKPICSLEHEGIYTLSCFYHCLKLRPDMIGDL